MSAGERYDEDRLGRLLGALPPAPEEWTRAAQALPAARRELDQLVARAVESEAFRAEVEADLERALTNAGREPCPRLVEELRERLRR